MSGQAIRTNGDVWAEHGHPGEPCAPPGAVHGDGVCRLRESACPNEHGPDGVIACWNPGGPCPEGRTSCESCGACAHCLPAAERFEVAQVFHGARWLAPEREALIARIKADAVRAAHAERDAEIEALAAHWDALTKGESPSARQVRALKRAKD